MKMLSMILMVLAISAVGLLAEGTGWTKPVADNIGLARPQYKITATQSGKTIGTIVIELFPDIAPNHCHNFDSLVAAKFYDGTAFHRVIPGFMVQGGDPNSKTNPDKATWGMGAPGQNMVNAEFSKLSHKRGIMSAARRGNNINSATSQFFLCVGDASYLDSQYTIYGQVVTGMDIVDAIVALPRDSRDNPNEKVEMKIEKIK